MDTLSRLVDIENLGKTTVAELLNELATSGAPVAHIRFTRESGETVGGIALIGGADASALFDALDQKWDELQEAEDDNI